MTKCKICGENHNIQYHLAEKVEHGGYPSSQKRYVTAHKFADSMEKKRFPKGYSQMKKVDDKLPKGEDAGSNTKSGKITVSKKVPRRLRKEVAYHEEVENKKLRKK